MVDYSKPLTKDEINEFEDFLSQYLPKKEANEEATYKEPPIRMCMFINFPNGIPIPALRKRWDEYEDWVKNEKQRLDIFNEMMGEGSIRAGSNGVGEPIRRGWGHKK